MKKTMFKRIFAGIAAVFTLGLCVPTGFTNIITQPSFEAVAEDEWLDTHGIEYKIKDRDTLIINNNSDTPIELYDFYFKSYAADIKHLQIGNGWKIHSFRGLTAIESLTIGDNCTIREDAFEDCAALTSVKIGDDCNIEEMAFWECASLTSIKIGDGCDIGEMAFWECTSLTSVEIGDGCTIERKAFDGCTALTSVTIGNRCKLADFINERNENLGNSAFRKCTSLTSVEIGDNCNIGVDVFYGCAALASVKIGDGCDIGDSVFRDCKVLTNVTIGNGCTVNTYAFLNRTSLANVTFGDNCTIEFMAFRNCNSIQKVICKGDKNTVTVDYNNPEIIRNKDKWTIITGTICPKCYCNAIDYKCGSCGYFDEAFVDAEIARLNALKQKYGTNTTEPPTTTNEGNTAASVIADGSVLAVIGFSTFLILCGLAAVIIVKRRKKTE